MAIKYRTQSIKRSIVRWDGDLHIDVDAAAPAVRDAVVVGVNRELDVGNDASGKAMRPLGSKGFDLGEIADTYLARRAAAGVPWQGRALYLTGQLRKAIRGRIRRIKKTEAVRVVVAMTGSRRETSLTKTGVRYTGRRTPFRLIAEILYRLNRKPVAMSSRTQFDVVDSLQKHLVIRKTTLPLT